jgi:hypothetical protein
MNAKEILYIAQEDLYRVGNAASSLISRLRDFEVDTYEVNGVTMVTSNDKGISLYNKVGIDKIPLAGWVWVINAGTSFPMGLRLIKDDKPEGHYTLAPAYNMLLSEYVSLLEKVAIQCQKLFKKKA